MDEYLSANLMTPKQRLIKAEPGLRREFLLDSQQLKLIRAVYEQSPQTFDDATKAAVDIARVVRQTVDFAPTLANSPLLDAVEVANREATNFLAMSLLPQNVWSSSALSILSVMRISTPW